MKLTACFSDDEWRAIRGAAMRGRLDAELTRHGEQVTFSVSNRQKFCRQIERVVDFGATDAFAVFNVRERVR